LVTDVLDLVARSVSLSTFQDISLVETYPRRISQELENEDQLSAARDALIISLSNVSTTLEFAEKHPLDLTLVKTLYKWLSIPELSS